MQKTLNNFYLIMDYCNGGDLEKLRAARGGRFTEIESRLILRQLVNGLSAINEKKVIHRDLKLPNILVHFPELSLSPDEIGSFNLREFMQNADLVGDIGDSQPRVEVKIGDLGFARKLEVSDLA
mmetsp:Transcript_119621/g.166864  ORF Transcript_119621/g.166864 Transcript_119621/m.166864 type:complete len:124 (+) Transcript_119621:325-696(+)|eukprot:CAMPEP_0176346362 /NCGR_PEP_ID=MMETSP0126-20121128/6186_1 /TAXON_ID=141414 ORGANISM="Strombidinopsis acuminatum, Strain SPMC142" /NCGR_SAMPLE_ID=MMETSP0126 /ASSEMBLY_ACC=CAM_ASM_000229 /LENGTH=123 /DNA_ID=CAMNT_0017693871 /DNA_START=325 /DNA_END=696 /DNA_ORIENTATION=-